jgi:hypothetical protein
VIVEVDDGKHSGMPEFSWFVCWNRNMFFKGFRCDFHLKVVVIKISV